MKILLYNSGYFEGVNGSFFNYIFCKVKSVFYKNYQNTIATNFIKSIKGQNYDHFLLVEIKNDTYKYLLEKHVLNGYFDMKYHPHSILRKFLFFKGNGNAVFSLEEKTSQSSFFKRKSEGGIFSAKKLYIESHTPSGVKILLLHLPLGIKARKQQLDELIEQYSNYNGPLIVAGDFNIFGGYVELEKITHALGLKILSPGNTFPSISPNHSLDLFLIRGLKNPSTQFATHISNISDHLAIELVFD